MKKSLFVVAFALVTASLFAQDAKPKKSDAIVEQYKGIYVFVDCVPKAEYKFLGSVNSGSGLGKAMMGAPEYEQKKVKLIDKAKEEFPEADGVILHFVKGGKDTADAIKFKE
jgi:hypothetical protein